MTNLTKLKSSDKSMTHLLRVKYKRRDDLLRQVEGLSKAISKLEKSKNNCKARIREVRSERKKLK